MARRYAAMAAAVLTLVTLGPVAPAGAAAEDGQPRAVEYSGNVVGVACPVVNGTIDPETGDWYFEFDGITSLLTGDLAGYDESRGWATFNPNTGDVRGYFYDTFHGTFTPEGAYGTFTAEGYTTRDGYDGQTVHDQRITGGTGVFAGARGSRIGTVLQPGCLGIGTYIGRLIRPSSAHTTVTPSWPPSQGASEQPGTPRSVAIVAQRTGT